MIKVFTFAGEKPLEFLFCVLLALVPSLIWIAVFNKKHREKKSVIAFNFVLGMFSALIVLAYQFFWGQKFNLGFFAIEPPNFQKNISDNFAHPILISALVFLSVGFLEEYSKHWVVKKGSTKFFQSVSDVVELSIVAALGFAFLENIGYFFQMILIGKSQNLPGLFLMRSVFVVFIHILCSGIYGYFYGLGFFSQPLFQDDSKDCIAHKFLIPKVLHHVFHLSEERTFHNEMISLGLVVSVLLHGLYDFILDVNISLGSIFKIEQLSGIGLHILALPLFFSLGIFSLSRILRSQKKNFGHKITKDLFVQ